MKKIALALSSAALAAALLSGCAEDAAEETCGPPQPVTVNVNGVPAQTTPAPAAPHAASTGDVAINLTSFDFALRGGGGGGGRSGGGGARSGGGSRSGGSGGGGGRSSYTAPKVGSKPKAGEGGVRVPSSSRPNKTYTSNSTTNNYTYVRQSDGMWLPFYMGMVMGEALDNDHIPAGCR